MSALTADQQCAEAVIIDSFFNGPLTISEAISALIECGHSPDDAERILDEAIEWEQDRRFGS